MEKVYLSVFGSGLGHATRMIEIAKELEKDGLNIVFSSYGEAAKLIIKKGFKCITIPPVDVIYSNSGELQTYATLVSFPVIFYASYFQFAFELKNISGMNPHVVVSDSLPTSVVAGVSLRKPVVTLLNQAYVMPSSKLPSPLYRAVTMGSHSGLTKVWNRSRKVIVPDLPPPYTISETNIAGLDKSKLVYSGFIMTNSEIEPDPLALELAREKRKKILWLISGPERTRYLLVKKAVQIARELSDDYSFVITAGNPLGSPSPYRIGDVIFYEWCNVQSFLIRVCDAVISRAGHGTIGQLINMGKPAILIPIKNQTEQEANAEKAEKLGIAIKLDQDNVSSEVVRKGLQDLFSGNYFFNAKKIRDVALSLEPVKICKDIILSYL